MDSKPREVNPRSSGYSVYGQVIWKTHSPSTELHLMVQQADLSALNRNVGETESMK
jgi:hypothetical protein